MNDLPREVRDALRRVDVDWTDERADRVLVRLRLNGRPAPRRTRFVLLAAAAVVILMVGGAAAATALHFSRSVQPSLREGAALVPVSRRPPARSAVRLKDGSVVTPADDTTDVVVQNVAADQVDLGLATGTVHMDIVGRDDRVFHIDAGDVRVEANRGVFTVARRGERVHVAVERGPVRVLWSAGEARLDDGGTGDFPRPARSPSPQGIATSTAAATPRARMTSAPATPAAAPSFVPAVGATWRVRAQEGDYDSAFRALQAAGTAAVRDEAGDLLLEADVARLSHHPADALAPLERTIEEYAADPRAPLAAFTLGRVLLDELGRPREAARAFAKARELGAGGPLEEDALAREVEAMSRAGDTAGARSRAELYVNGYPDGRRLRAVRKFGGLD
jgi:transmembrane sensor